VEGTKVREQLDMADSRARLIKSLGHHAAKHTAGESTVMEDLCRAFEESQLSLAHRLEAFSAHVRRQDIARFLTKVELFKLAINSHGSIVECGVYSGAGLMTWMHCSSIFEPYNHTRRIVGFDTFDGFPSVSAEDNSPSAEHVREGAFRLHSGARQELEHLIAIHDRNRPIGHIAKVELVAGDATKTIPQYLKDNPHFLISLMYLDFDIYEPTKAALEHFLPRVVSGGIVAFDELNCREFPGETTALLEKLSLDRVALRRFPADPYISYFIK
jgi:hypothetical protein